MVYMANKNMSCSAPYDCDSPRPLLLVSSKVQLDILRVIRHRLTRGDDKTHNTINHPTAHQLVQHSHTHNTFGCRQKKIPSGFVIVGVQSKAKNHLGGKA